jgi:hypothetical protein
MFSFKDIPLEIPFLFFLPPSVRKHKTFKRYLIVITCYRSIDVKQRRKSVVAALEAGESRLYRFLRQRFRTIPPLQAKEYADFSIITKFPRLIVAALEDGIVTYIHLTQ